MKVSTLLLAFVGVALALPTSKGGLLNHDGLAAQQEVSSSQTKLGHGENDQSVDLTTPENTKKPRLVKRK
jgi:hypothetical protein